MRKLLALLVVLVVSGCNADATAPKRQQPVEQVASGGTPTPAVSTAASRQPYLLKGRVHAGGREVPGRYQGLVVRANTWLGRVGPPGAWAWGVGSALHGLAPGVAGARLSNNGRYLATLGPDSPCSSSGKGVCEVRFQDTSGRSPARRLDLRAPYDLIGVTDDGTVLLREFAGGQDGQLWRAAQGDSELTPARMAPGQPWPLSLSSWEEGSLGLGGFTWSSANSRDGHGPNERWIGDFVDNELRPRFRIPPNVELGPDRRWVLADPWASYKRERNLEGALEPTVPTLRARTLGKRGRLGAPVQLTAPTGWSFARATVADDVVFWEDADTFLARMVDSRQSGDRLARCDLPLAACVLVGS